ncbi:hypothetical protein GCM10009674_17420 [Nesterenkonia xinjiangensis]
MSRAPGFNGPMPTVMLINGAPASGKSTLARLLAQDRAMTLVLDVDTIRGFLTDWQEAPTAAGLAARQLALAMCEIHVSAGHDVIVPQFLQRAPFIDELGAVARRGGARFQEVCLMSSAEQAAAQFAARSQSRDPNHQAAQMLQSGPGATAVGGLHEAMCDMVSRRPQTICVRCVPGDVEGSLARLRAATRETQ